MQAGRLDLRHDQHLDALHQKVHLQCRAILDLALRSVDDEQDPLTLDLSRDKTVQQLALANRRQQVLLTNQQLRFDQCENFRIRQATRSADRFDRIRVPNRPDQVASGGRQVLRQMRCAQSAPDKCRPLMLRSSRGSSRRRFWLFRDIRRRGR